MAGPGRMRVFVLPHHGRVEIKVINSFTTTIVHAILTATATIFAMQNELMSNYPIRNINNIAA